MEKSPIFMHLTVGRKQTNLSFANNFSEKWVLKFICSLFYEKVTFGPLPAVKNENDCARLIICEMAIQILISI